MEARTRTRSVRSLAANAATIALLGAGLLLTVSASQAILEGRAQTLGPSWVWMGALVCPFLAVQLLRAGSAFVRGQPAILTMASLRLLLIVVVAVWIDLLVFGQPFHPVQTYMALGLAIGVFSLLVTLRRPLSSKIPERGLRVADLMLTYVCLVLIGTEFSLRAVNSVLHLPLLARIADSPAQALDRNRFSPGTLRYGYPCNSGGHYDREFTPSPPEGKLIASIGDSFSAGVVPLPYHFTKVLEDRLTDVPVYNLGVPAIGPREYLHMLVTEALPLNPEVLVVNLFMGNELGESRGRSYPLLRSWFDRDNVLIYLAPVRIVALLREAPNFGEWGDAARPIPTGSPAETREALHEMFPWVLDPMLESATFSEEAYLDIESSRAGWLLRPGSTYEPLFERLVEMRDAAGDVPLVFVLIPDEYQVEDALWEKVRATLPDEPERFRHQRVIGAWLEEQGIPYLDLLPLLRSVEPLNDGRRHVYKLRDTHFNVRGNEIAGVALAEILSEQFGFAKKDR